MYEISQEYKDKLNQRGIVKKGYLNLINNSKITKYTESDIKSFTILDDIYTPDEGIVGSVIAKQIEGYLFKAPNTTLIDKEIEAYIGVSGEEEYIPMGRFIIQKPEDNKITDKAYFIGLDYMVKFNLSYEDKLVYPCTLKDVLEAICEQCEVTLGSTSFTNDNFIVENNQFVAGESCRDVLSAICQIAGCYAKIGRDNKLYLLLTNNTDEKFLPSDYTSSSFEMNNVFGGVNRVVIKMSGVEGENVTLEDKEMQEYPSSTSKNICPTDLDMWELGHYSLANGNKENNQARARVNILIPINNYESYYFDTFTDDIKFVLRTYKEDKSYNRSIGAVNNKAIISNFTKDDCYLGITLSNPSDESGNYGQTILDLISNGIIKPFITISSNEKVFSQYAKIGVQEIAIVDNPFLYTQGKRQSVITNLFNKLKGFRYIDFNMDVRTVKPYIDAGDKIEIKTPNEDVYITYVFSHEITFNGGLKSNMNATAPTNIETKYAFTPTSEKKRIRTEYIVDKSIGEIRQEVELLDDEFTEQMAQVTVNLNEITSRIDKFTNFTKTVSTKNEETGIIAPRVYLDDALPTNILKLVIYAENTLSGIYPSQTLFPSTTLFPQKAGNLFTIFVANDNAESVYKEFNIQIISPLKEYNGTHDQLVIEFNQDTGTCEVKVYRYIQKIGNIYTIYNEPKIETIYTDFPIELYEGDNYIRIKSDGDFVNWEFEATYIYGNELNEKYATKVETSSMIKLSEDNILLQVDQELGGKADSDKIISLINLSPEEITIQSSKISLEGYTTINGGFSVDEEGNASIANGAVRIDNNGIQMADGTSIVGGKGMMTNMEFVGHGNMNDGISGNYYQVGFRTNSITSSNFKAKITIDAYIPENFTITKAIVVLSHFPLKVQYQGQDKGYGYSRAVKIYSSSNSARYRVWNIGSEFFDEETGYDSEIDIKNMKNGWTPKDYDRHKIENIVTDDIKNSLNNGINRLIIQSSEDIPTFSYDDNNQINCLLRTGMMSATLEVYGFMKPIFEEE